MVGQVGVELGWGMQRERGLGAYTYVEWGLGELPCGKKASRVRQDVLCMASLRGGKPARPSVDWTWAGAACGARGCAVGPQLCS